jgi:lipid A 3-O-deacylase
MPGGRRHRTLVVIFTRQAMTPLFLPLDRHTCVAWTLAALAGLHLAASSACAAPALESPLVSSTFVQAGFANDARAYVVGASWNWRWKKSLRWGEITGYWESSIGQWRTRHGPEGDHSALVTQVGLTPVLRWAPGGTTSRLFLELGIGANVLFPIYETDDKRFSTTFNFGDHLAVGHRVGRHEVSLRLQHFSNAGIRHPNPGENFLQLRYAVRY